MSPQSRLLSVVVASRSLFLLGRLLSFVPKSHKKRVSCCCNETWIEVFRQPNSFYTQCLPNDSWFYFFASIHREEAQHDGRSPFVQFSFFFSRALEREHLSFNKANGSWSGHVCVDTFILNVSRFSLASLWNLSLCHSLSISTSIIQCSSS